MTRRGACSTAWLYAALLWFVLLLAVGCATDPEIEAALRAYDRAAEMGLTARRTDRPYARINDGAPWSRRRGVEIAR